MYDRRRLHWSACGAWRMALDWAWGAASPDVEEVTMLEGKTRIPPVDVETLPDDLREVLEEQRKLRGAPLYPVPLLRSRDPALTLYCTADASRFVCSALEARKRATASAWT